MIKKDKGVQLVAVGKEFDPIPAQFKAAQRETNIATAKNFGVKDPAAIIDFYEKAVEKWRAKSKEIGREVFTPVLLCRPPRRRGDGGEVRPASASHRRTAHPPRTCAE